MNVVDSSCWLEYFAGNKRAEQFRASIEDPARLLVPVIVLYEVFKKILLEKSEKEALVCIAHMKQGIVVDLDEIIALKAAKLSAELKLPMADSIILAITQNFDAVLFTQDDHFEGMQNVSYYKK